MQNEILLIISLLISYSAVTLLFRFFKAEGLFVWVAICTILANIEVTILVNAFGMEQTLGNTLFASTFLATDILSELCGKKKANKAVLVGIFSSCVFIVFSNLWVRYVPSENDFVMDSIKTVFSNTPRILIASLLAYCVSQFFDVWIYHKWWALTEKITGSKEKLLWLRNNGSTLLSQAINILIFNFGAFYGVYNIETLISITISCYLIYVCTSLLDTPFVYLTKKLSQGK